jgi:hypothetical protein
MTYGYDPEFTERGTLAACEREHRRLIGRARTVAAELQARATRHRTPPVAGPEELHRAAAYDDAAELVREILGRAR